MESEDEDEDEEYIWGLWNEERTYPPIIPAELTDCLDRAPAILESARHCQEVLDHALSILQSAQLSFAADH
jgi:hypothetical protein